MSQLLLLVPARRAQLTINRHHFLQVTTLVASARSSRPANHQPAQFLQASLVAGARIAQLVPSPYYSKC